MPKILATGLSGTIGRHLTDHVRPLEIRLDEDFSVDRAELEDSTLIHLAAMVGEAKVRTNLALAQTINVTASAKLARLALESRVRRFIYVSTSHVYDLSAEPVLLTEAHPALPRGHYALQKLLAEELIKDVFKDEPDRLIIARVFSVVDHSQPEGTLGDSLRRLCLDEHHLVHFADDVRDFLSPQIISDVLYRLAIHEALYGVVNVCSGRPLSIRDVAALMLPVERLSEVAPRIVAGESSVPRIVGDPRKLNAALDLKPDSLFEKFAAQMRLSRGA